ncbi:MAG: hypothetical protein MUF15_04350 [Acidobacteria bacterium]|nr:hypothetical protein [Acidobacteriota bacterium]
MEIGKEISNQRRCKMCVIPNSGNMIEFDDDGVCLLCKSNAPDHESNQVVVSERHLEKNIEKIKKLGHGRDYDCLVGFSGGRDSTYMLYMLTQKHGLRCLAAYYRTPFTHETIDSNVKRIAAKLNVKLVEMDISKEYHKKIAGEFVNLWRQTQNPIMANLACAPCKLVNREVYRIAARNKIKAIVYGTNIFEAVQIAAGISNKSIITKTNTNTGIYRKLWSNVTKFSLLTKRGIGLLRNSLKVWKYIPLGIQSSLLYIAPHTLYLGLRYPRIYAMNYFYETDWNEQKCHEILNELGWQLPPGCKSTWRADCAFSELKNYMLYKSIGITYTDAFFSNMVRAGILTREEALARIQVEGQLSSERFNEVFEILNLPLDF